jgi:hypothetical protein
VGATVTRNGKTYYKGDDGKLYPNYDAAARATDSRRMAQPLLNNQAPGNVADQRSSMLAAASGAPINLRGATLGLISPFGGVVPGGPAYGAVRNGRQVLVQRGAAGTGAANVGSVNFAGQTLDALTVGNDVMWVPRGTRPTEIENRYGIPVSPPADGKADPATDLKADPATVAPGLIPPVAYGDPAARAREAEQRRMMQQYASKEYWDTEQGKAMLGLGQQMTAPKDAKLADYYGAQRAAGIGAMSEILEGLASVDDRYKEGGDLRKWAEVNQGLALREYNKRFPGGFSNDEALGSAPAGYENSVSTYEAHGAPQESVDAFLAAQQARGNAAFRDLAKYPLTQSAGTTAPVPDAPGGYVPDTQLSIAPPPVQPDDARESNLEPATQAAQHQRADELLKRHKDKTRGQLLTGI